MERVIAYIDGFNLYHGLRQKGWKWFYKLNIQAFVKNILKTHQILVKTKYFTSIVNIAVDKHDRQITFLEVIMDIVHTLYMGVLRPLCLYMGIFFVFYVHYVQNYT